MMSKEKIEKKKLCFKYNIDETGYEERISGFSNFNWCIIEVIDPEEDPLGKE